MHYVNVSVHYSVCTACMFYCAAELFVICFVVVVLWLNVMVFLCLSRS